MPYLLYKGNYRATLILVSNFKVICFCQTVSTRSLEVESAAIKRSVMRVSSSGTGGEGCGKSKISLQ